MQHSVPRCSDVYFQLRQNVPVQTAGIGKKQNLEDMSTWTLELRYHHHSQILGSPSKYSQRHREQGCAYNVKEMRFVNKRNAHDTKHHKSLQRQHPVTKHGFKTQTARGARTYTKVTAFLVLIHFLLMKIKMPMMAQTRQRLPTRQVTMSGGSTGIETSSSQCSPW